MSVSDSIHEIAIKRFVAHLGAAFPGIVWRNKLRPADLEKGQRVLVVAQAGWSRPPDAQVIGRKTFHAPWTVEGYIGVDVGAGEDQGEALDHFYVELVEAVEEIALQLRADGLLYDLVEVDTDQEIDRDAGHAVTVAFATVFEARYRTALLTPRQAA
jgi:hypothetical protein